MPFAVDLRRTAGTISPLWFGHNLEHTRSSVWRGLSAQLIRNRKFAGKPQRPGVALEWYPIGPGSTSYRLDESGAFTAHYDPDNRRRNNEILCQRVESFRDGVRCGIGQERVPVIGGRRYEMRLALRSSRALAVRVRLGRTEKSLRVKPGRWREFRFRFLMPGRGREANLEVTFDRAAKFAVGAVSLLPADHFHGMRRDVVALLKRMSVNILRWPGGNFAGDYRWQDGLLPVDRRAPLASFMEMETLPHSHGFDTHEIGTDEYVALCREVGAEPFISINIAWESPEMASAWVEYCNGGPRTKWGKVRASRGHREPFNVKYWSLGNEMGYTHMEGPNAPAAYAAKAVACARAMRKAGRRIVLVSSGFWSGNRWFKEALPLLWRDVDHLSHHYYTRSLTEHAGSAGRANFRSIVTRPAHVLEQLREIRRKMARRIPRRKFVGIAFDEWNVWYAWYRIPSVADGVHAASMLNMFCREAADVGMTIGCYFEPVNEGAILVEPASARLTPVGEVFELYRAHRGNTLIRLDPQKPDADIDVTVSRNERTKEVVATVVNRSPDNARAVALAFPGADGLRIVEAVLLEGKDLLPASGFARKKLVVTVKNGRARMVLPKHSVTRMRFAPR